MDSLASLIAAALLATGTVGQTPPDPKPSVLNAPQPASLERGDVTAWMRRYVRAADWTLLAYDTEGVKLAPPRGVAKTPDGLAETDVRTELFKPIAISAGTARSGMARWSVDCEQGLLAVTSMTVYAGNNLQGELAHRVTGEPVWQSPVGAEFDAMREVCRAIGREAKLAPAPTPPR